MWDLTGWLSSPYNALNKITIVTDAGFVLVYCVSKYFFEYAEKKVFLKLASN